MQYYDLPASAQNYLNYLLTIKGRSLRTVDGYAVDLRTFFRFLKQKKYPNTSFEEQVINDLTLEEIASISLSDVYEFLHFTMNQRSNSAKTRARKVSSLRGFFNYLTINQLIKENPIKNLEMPSVKKSLPVYLNIDQSIQLLSSAENKLESPSRYRDYCILTLFLNCGMRLSELVGINLADFNFESKKLKILGKVNKERIIYLNEACESAIDNYLTKERSHLKKVVDSQALFLSIRTGKRLGARQIQSIVSQALKDAGLNDMGFSVHKLRHTAATLMYQEGHVDLLVLKELWGHVNVGTTEIYTHVANEKIQEAVEKNPLAHLHEKKK